jgi:hypothetical protein
MGQLETAAEVTHPAPWEGATPEEDMAYDQAVKFGDVEFEADIKNYMGPYGSEAIDADRATMLQEGGWNIHGLHVAPEYDTDPELKEIVDERYGPVFEKAGEKIEGDMVYTVGPEYADTRLWAHEFLHRFRNSKEMRALGGEERFVRLFSAYRASTPEQWIGAVDMWRDIVMRRPDSPDSMNLREAEKHLKKSLDTWKDDFIRIEAEAAEEKGIPAKRRNWQIDSLRADYRELAEGREGIRDIGKSQPYKEILKAREKENGAQN